MDFVDSSDPYPGDSEFCLQPAGPHSAGQLMFRCGAAAGDAARGFALGQPLLDGHGSEIWALAGDFVEASGGLRCIYADGLVAGYGSVPVRPATLEMQTRSLYEALLETIGNRALYRIWNFVPGINHIEPGKLENYRLFCSGRAAAFAERVAAMGEQLTLPSASATGSLHDRLGVFFLAGDAPALNWENPQQVSAYRYPPAYGPHPPSFSRATRVVLANGEWLFISGTAAIKGSETCHPGDFAAQLPVTLENLHTVAAAAGMDLARRPAGQRCHARVFLRQPAYREQLLAELQTQRSRFYDSLSVVHADICRADLELEIELTLYPAAAHLAPGAGINRNQR